LKFVNFDEQSKEYSFDFDLFQDVIGTVITAQDIIVDKAVYPTELITQNSHKYRPLGLGYTNLGAFLMYLGLPYDSDDGRFVASQLTAILSGCAFMTSHKLAKLKEPFERFEANREPYYKVLKLHNLTLKDIENKYFNEFSRNLKEISKIIWSDVLDLVENNEPFRNAQVTLLAPTGTTSFVMDAQTTGVEPEFSHVKYKRLSNTDGSVLKSVSPLTSICLKNLGYTEKEIKTINQFIQENLPLKNCEELQKEHQRIFDTSVNTYPEQVIHHDGHIKMLAAVQPFISGGISKTITLPNNATVEDVFKCYLDCWRLGLKGVTVYRDGSKNYQPLSSTNEKEKEDDEYEYEQITLEDIKHDDRLIKHLHAMLAERKLPPERPAIIYKFNVGGVKGFLTCGLYEDGDLGEIFINISKEGSTLSGLLDCLATVVSISLQKGVPLKDIVEKMLWQKFEPYGFTTDKDIKTATSLVDFIFKYLGMKFLSFEDKKELGLVTEESIKNSYQTDEDDEEVKSSFNNTSLLNTFAGPSCNNCGTIMIKKGNCFLCMNCGSNNGACG